MLANSNSTNSVYLYELNLSLNVLQIVEINVLKISSLFNFIPFRVSVNGITLILGLSVLFY